MLIHSLADACPHVDHHFRQLHGIISGLFPERAVTSCRFLSGRTTREVIARRVNSTAAVDTEAIRRRVDVPTIIVPVSVTNADRSASCPSFTLGVAGVPSTYIADSRRQMSPSASLISDAAFTENYVEYKGINYGYRNCAHFWK